MKKINSIRIVKSQKKWIYLDVLPFAVVNGHDTEGESYTVLDKSWCYKIERTEIEKRDNF